MKRLCWILPFLFSAMVSGAQELSDAQGQTEAPVWVREYMAKVMANSIPNAMAGRDAVPDAETAVALAEAYLIPVYGKKEIFGERPFQAVLLNGYWVIFGSLPKGWLGGVAQIIIEKKSGSVIHITHGQ